MLSAFFQYINSEKRYSPRTIDAYYDDVQQLANYFCLLPDELARVSHKELRGWCAALLAQGLSPRSVNRKIASVRAFYKFLVKQQIISQNPMDRVVPPKANKPLPFFYSEEQMQAVLSAPPIGQEVTYEQERNHVIMELLYATGMRQAELLGLRIVDVDFENQTLKVKGKGAKERIIPLAPHLCQVTHRYLSEVLPAQFSIVAESPLFYTIKGKALTSRQLYDIVHGVLAQHGVNGQKSPHVLRHTCATHLLNRGADLNSIKELLGHAGLNATQVYTHTDIETLMKTYRDAHPRA